MPSNDPSKRRAEHGRASASDDAGSTPIAFYVMMAAIGAALLYALVTVLFL